MDMKEMDFEAALNELEEIANKLEKGEVSLDESLELYARSFKLIKGCSKKLKAAKQRIISLSEAEENEQ